MIEKAVRNFILDLKQVDDARLRMALLASGFVLIFFGIYFSRLFLPTEIAAGDALQDYAAFYAAARAVLDGNTAGLYDWANFQDAIGEQTSLIWHYPPTMTLALAPFGLLPYGAAKVVWASMTLAAGYGVARIAAAPLGWGVIAALSPAAYACLYVGQVSALFAFALIAGLMLAKNRPVLAGALIAFVTLKPQYGLLVIPFLAFTGAWRAMLFAALFSLLMIGASTAALGIDAWRAFFASLLDGPTAAHYQSGGHPGRITLSDGIKGAGIDAPPALLLYLPLFAGAIAALYWLRDKASRPMLIAFTLAASALICPYLFVYDFFLYNGAVLIAATQIKQMRAFDAYALGALWLAAFIPFIGGSAITPTWLWPVTAFAVFTLFTLAKNSPVLGAAAPTR